MNDIITSVFCKKSFRQSGEQKLLRVYCKFDEGIFYKNFIIEEDDLIFSNKIPYRYKYIYIYNAGGSAIGKYCGCRFHLNKFDHTNELPNFYDYFYDNKEIRKLKLKKIKSIS